MASFGRVLRFKDELRRLAATVMCSMNTKYEIGLDVSKKGIQKGTFFGAQYVLHSRSWSSGGQSFRKSYKCKDGASETNARVRK